MAGGGMHMGPPRLHMRGKSFDKYNFGPGSTEEEFLPAKKAFVQSLMKRNDSFTLEYCNTPTTRHAVDMLYDMITPDVVIMTMNGKATTFDRSSTDQMLPLKRPSKLREATHRMPWSAHITMVDNNKPKTYRKAANHQVAACERETYAKAETSSFPSSSGRDLKPVAVSIGACNHCGETESPQWRKGPTEKPYLCNACGTRYLRTGSLKRSGARRSGNREQAEGEFSSAKRARNGSAKPSPKTSDDFS
eukprot:CAMPEP_0198210574 /NCGR_PEP_ID=MMETSP1445-20131203/20717_1 /TAXON_ID=36898 /ORGANISM="Pyramimonas sp., Strain CCMP2087" /LENGTH=247 /DNA_ID=CAMNT_0043884663 /DNA_START=448 /DNA_END=1191 /DNA_ORIENTATION=-